MAVPFKTGQRDWCSFIAAFFDRFCPISHTVIEQNPMQHVGGFIALLFLFSVCAIGRAEESETKPAKQIKMVETELAKGRVQVKVPTTWKMPAKRRSRIIEREYQIPAAKGDKTPGRLTMMQAMGSLKLNIDRWYGQFTQPDGKPTKDVAKVKEMKVNGQNVTVVDISGTFSETMGGGPFSGGKTVTREGYRMLGGIVQAKGVGQYFFKLYGPEKTVAEAEKGYIAMLKSVSVKDAPSR